MLVPLYLTRQRCANIERMRRACWYDLQRSDGRGQQHWMQLRKWMHLLRLLLRQVGAKQVALCVALAYCQLMSLAVARRAPQAFTEVDSQAMSS